MCDMTGLHFAQPTAATVCREARGEFRELSRSCFNCPTWGMAGGRMMTGQVERIEQTVHICGS